MVILMYWVRDGLVSVRDSYSYVIRLEMSFRGMVMFRY